MILILNFIVFLYKFSDKLFQAVKYFFNSSMPKAKGKTHVALIPKRDKSKSVKDYRLIFLYNVYYKVISKFISSRFKTVLSNLVSRE